MIGLDFERLSQQRVQDLRNESAGIAAARHAGAPTSARRIARLLRQVAERVDGESSPVYAPPLQGNQFRVGRLRPHAR